MEDIKSEADKKNTNHFRICKYVIRKHYICIKIPSNDKPH